jgi:ribosomal protein S27AE
MTPESHDDVAGDPVCWLHLACPECGAMPDPGEEDLDRCPRCGALRAQPSERPPPDR